jgi:hypothetical protein
MDKSSLQQSISKDAHGNVVVSDAHLKTLLEQGINEAQNPGGTRAVSVSVSVDF